MNDGLFSGAARVLGEDIEGPGEDKPNQVELRAHVAQMPGVREKLEAEGIEVVQVSRKELRRRNAELKRKARKQQAKPPVMFVDGGEAKEARRLERNKRKARKRGP